MVDVDNDDNEVSQSNHQNGHVDHNGHIVDVTGGSRDPRLLSTVARRLWEKYVMNDGY